MARCIHCGAPANPENTVESTDFGHNADEYCDDCYDEEFEDDEDDEDD